MKKHFVPIIYMAGLLIAIVVLAMNDQILFAKIAGIILVVSFAWYIRQWLRQGIREKKFRDSVAININDVWVLNEWLYWKQANKAEKKEIKKRMSFTIGQFVCVGWEKNSNAREDLLVLGFCAILSGADQGMNTKRKEVEMQPIQEKIELITGIDSNKLLISEGDFTELRAQLNTNTTLTDDLRNVFQNFFKN
jgi:hypothetical protein